MEFIRKNPALAVGIGLPFVVVVFFALAALIPQWTVAPPRYDALFAVRANGCCIDAGEGIETKFSVVNGRLQGYWRKRPKQSNQQFDAQLFLFDAKTLSVHEIALPVLPLPNSKSDDWQEYTVPDAEALKLDPRMTAPDGYQFHDDYRTNGEVWPFFSGGNGQERIFIGKDGRDVKLVVPGRAYAYSENIHFLGWVESGNDK